MARLRDSSGAVSIAQTLRSRDPSSAAANAPALRDLRKRVVRTYRSVGEQWSGARGQV